MMYMTRMRLNPSKPGTKKAFKCPSLFHGAVENACGLTDDRKLWRVDRAKGAHYLMIVSSREPDLASAAMQFGFPYEVHPWESQQYDDSIRKIKKGSKWHFRLTANPTKSISPSDGAKTRGVVRACTEADTQIDWLLRRAEKNGFHVEKEDVKITGTKWYQFSKGPAAGHRVSLMSVVYEGTLEITDPILFANALISGIGRGKAYGQGMLTIAG